MGTLNRIATLLVVLSVSSGAPATYAIAVGTAPCALCPPLQAVGDEALHPGRLPAEPTASRDGNRSTLAAAWRSVQPQLSILSAAVAIPTPRRSHALNRAVGPPRASASPSSSSVRGPPAL